MSVEKRLKNDPNRAYRGVLLRADEAAQLNRDVDNQYAGMCPHLSVFHNQGRTTAGGYWRSCLICAEVEETPPDQRIAEEKALAAQEERGARNNLVSVCLLLGWLFGVLCMIAAGLLGWWHP